MKCLCNKIIAVVILSCYLKITRASNQTNGHLVLHHDSLTLALKWDDDALAKTPHLPPAGKYGYYCLLKRARLSFSS